MATGLALKRNSRRIFPHAGAFCTYVVDQTTRVDVSQFLEQVHNISFDLEWS